MGPNENNGRRGSDRPTDPETILVACAKGNKEAEQFLRVFVARAHFLDDLVDEAMDGMGVMRRIEAIGRHETDWLLALAGNSFFLKHSNLLMLPMITALNSWVDSNDMVGMERDVLKGQWHEVVFAVAFIVGGHQHLRDMTVRYREYDFEEEKENTSPRPSPPSDGGEGVETTLTSPETFNPLAPHPAIRI